MTVGCDWEKPLGNLVSYRAFQVFLAFFGIKQLTNSDPRNCTSLSARPLSMPVLILGGEKSGGEFLIEQAKLVASNVQELFPAQAIG